MQILFSDDNVDRSGKHAFLATLSLTRFKHYLRPISILRIWRFRLEADRVSLILLLFFSRLIFMGRMA